MLEKKLQKNFTIADNRIAQSKLSYEARGLYFYMQSLPSDWQFSEERLARAGGIGIDKIKRILKELFAIGLLKREITKDERGYNKAKYILFDFDTIENPSVENPPLENPSVENPMYYKEIDSTKKDFNKEIDSTNSAERILSKKIDSNLTFDYLAYAKEKFENANDKPKVSLDLWLEFIKSKKLVLKKYRRKAITAKMIDLNFAELYKLSEIGVNLNERLNKAIADEWQGIWFASDSKEWQKRGGHFRNNVGHLDYDQSKNVDNPLRAIETHITI